MEMALLLVVLVVVELALTVWFLARQRLYLSEITALKGRMQAMEHDLNVVSENMGVLDAVNAPKCETVGGTDLQALASQASEDDLKKAAAILQALGLNDGE